MFKKIAAIAALTAMAAVPLSAAAGTESANINVNANVVADCLFNVGDNGTYTITLPPYDFVNGSADTGTTPTPASLQCSPDLANAPTLSFGANPLNLNGPNSGILQVSLNATWTYNNTGASSPLLLTATAGAGQNVPPGAYSGSTTLTVNF